MATAKALTIMFDFNDKIAPLQAGKKNTKKNTTAPQSAREVSQEEKLAKYREI